MGSVCDRLRVIIEKKMKVPTKVKTLLKNPSMPTIRFVAAAIIVMLDTIRNVRPPFACINSLAHGIKPSPKIDFSGAFIPPCKAKVTELKIAPIINKNKNIFTSDTRTNFISE